MTRRKSAGVPGLGFALSIAFACGIAFGALLLASFQRTGLIEARGPDARVVADTDTAEHEVPTVSPAGSADAGPDTPAPAEPPVIPGTAFERELILPVAGLSAESLRSSFDEARGGGSRRHEAIDILAPRGTPVIAADEGPVAKLFTSKAGGLTIYQFDPTGTYAYYYAHLDRYAPGLKEGARLRSGDVIGFVGTTGNAPPGTPHLHFAIFKLTEDRRWWEGTPIDPFPILSRPSRPGRTP
jgi:murein DD-endopeptidase MepM/ murein hydrolase activator NlpD